VEERILSCGGEVIAGGMTQPDNPSLYSRACTDLPLRPLTETGGSDGFLTNLPLDLLHAELLRRQETPEKPECGTRGKQGSYSTGLHVFALFLILALSTLGKNTTTPGRHELISCSMLLPYNRPSLSQTAYPAPLSLPLPPLRHRRPNRHSLHPPAPHRLRLTHRPLPPRLLE
jgi:hypothetical protein